MTISKYQTTTSSFKVGFWNIDGIKPKHTDKTVDEDFINLIESHDICGICETHLSENTVLDFNGYCVKSIFRKQPKNALRNYGGISVFFKEKLKKYISIVKKDQESNYIWVKISKKVINIGKDVYACFAHIPHEQSTYYEKLKYDILNNLYNDIVELSKNGFIVLMGDLNGRIGDLPDFIVNDTVDFLPVNTDYTCDTICKTRKTYDKTVNNRGKDILDLCIASNIKILN